MLFFYYFSVSAHNTEIEQLHSGRTQSYDYRGNRH